MPKSPDNDYIRYVEAKDRRQVNLAIIFFILLFIALLGFVYESSQQSEEMRELELSEARSRAELKKSLKEAESSSDPEVRRRAAEVKRMMKRDGLQ